MKSVKLNRWPRRTLTVRINSAHPITPAPKQKRIHRTGRPREMGLERQSACAEEKVLPFRQEEWGKILNLPLLTKF